MSSILLLDALVAERTDTEDDKDCDCWDCPDMLED